MFSGIIHHMGTITSIEPKNEGLIIHVANKEITNDSEVSQSVCNSGVCLTVIGKDGDNLIYEVGPGTLRKSTLGERKVGDSLNLETSLRVGEEIGGHFVYGHVDCVGEITRWKKDGDTILMDVRAPKEIMKYFAPRGSVAIDGVSLTIAEMGEDSITIMLLAHTLAMTTLGRLSVGDRVNVEADMMVKYVERVVGPYR